MLNQDEAQEPAEGRGPSDVPGDIAPLDGEEGQNEPSLTDDLLALFEDGKTYAEAEFAFQKSRAAFSADRVKGAVVFGLGALAMLHLALIALTVGLVVSLASVVGPWGATAIVTLGLLLIVLICVYLLKNRIDDVRGAFADKSDD